MTALMAAIKLAIFGVQDRSMCALHFVEVNFIPTKRIHFGILLMFIKMPTNMWLLMSLRDGDILNCISITNNRNVAFDTLVEHMEQDQTDNRWYKIVSFQSDRTISVGDDAWIVIKNTEEEGFSRVVVVGIYDQYETIPEQIRDNDDDYIVDGMKVV
ncbi:MAG: hypothetical protein EBS86_07755 [Crocinitomicaceae bacterium]|nr:hypothetical protein [Crocinitomicaceae bacterium]